AFSGAAKNLTPHTPVVVSVGGVPRRLGPELENNLFRMGQEALANAVKYADAQHIRVHIPFNPESVRLSVTDYRRCFDAASHRANGGGHLGLVGMRERAEQIGGNLTVRSAPGGGTEISVEVSTGQAKTLGAEPPAGGRD